MDDLNVMLGGIRALLCVSAFFSACVFVREVASSFDIVCAIIRGRVRSTQIIGLAAFGWFWLAISCVILTFHNLIVAVSSTGDYTGHFVPSMRFGWDAFWIAGGLSGMALGFYIPVLAILWYRGKLPQAIIIGSICPSVGLIFAGIARHATLMHH